MHAPDRPSAPEAKPWPPAAQQLKLPGCEHPLAYAWHYWPSTLRHLLRPHRLHASVSAPRLAAPVHIAPSLRQAWEQLFEVDARCPLLANQSVGTLLYTRLFGQLGLNFRQLLHVQHRVQHLASPEAFAAAGRQELVCKLQGCWRLQHQRPNRHGCCCCC